MRVSGAVLFPMLVLGALAAATFWLEQASQVEPGAPRAKDRHDVDFWVDGVHMRGFNAKGVPSHELQAQRLEHFPDDDTSIVIEPRLKYLENRRLSATAKRAWVDRQGDHVLLEDDVHVVQPGETSRSGREPDTIATTTRLHVFPDEEKARTDAPVTITQGQSVVTGQGGIAIDNNSQVTVLFGPATATIYRNPR